MTLAVVGALHEGERVTLRAGDDGTIAEIGHDVAALPGDEILDAEGLAMFPGLVNGHTHAAMTLMRGYGDDLPLHEWLEERIWPVEARLTADAVYWGTRLACVEMIRTGTVAFWDMYWHPDAVVRAVRDAGLRVAPSAPLFDAGGEAARDAGAAILDEYRDDPFVTPCLGPHSVYTAGEDLLRWVAETSSEYDAPVHIHCAETAKEVTDCRDEHGLHPVEYLDRLGLLTPRTLLAHCVHCGDEQLALIAQRGATVVTNPSSNLKLAVGGVFPYAAARRHGVALALGTDGAASNNALDLLAEVKLLALLAKFEASDPSVAPAAEAWEVATGGLAPALGGGGGLVAGAPADLILVRADAPELGPGDLLANLVYAASGAVVDTTIVGGNVLMRGGDVPEGTRVQQETLHQARDLGVLVAPAV